MPWAGRELRMAVPLASSQPSGWITACTKVCALAQLWQSCPQMQSQRNRELPNPDTTTYLNNENSAATMTDWKSEALLMSCRYHINLLNSEAGEEKGRRLK